QVAAAAIVLGGLLAHLLGGRRGLAVAAGVLLVALVADGMPFWGSDVGGVLASVPAFALVVLGLSGTKVSWRRLAALGAGAVAAVVGMALDDSGIAVPAMMLGVLNPVVVRLALRTDERDLSPAPLR